MEIPGSAPLGAILFSHCFTCNKDLKAIVRISRELAELGWQVLRYDFRGLGNSEGVFAHSNFSTNCNDLRSAYEFLIGVTSLPLLLMGHSFGGAASLAMAQDLQQVRGVIALAAPSDTHHLAALLERMDPKIAVEGTGEVTIGGFRYQIDRQMIDDFRQHDLPSLVRALSKPLLALHSPTDETVAYYHALRNCDWDNATERSQSPRSLVTLPNSNHLLTDEAHCKAIAGIIHAWSRTVDV